MKDLKRERETVERKAGIDREREEGRVESRERERGRKRGP